MLSHWWWDMHSQTYIYTQSIIACVCSRKFKVGTTYSERSRGGSSILKYPHNATLVSCHLWGQDTDEYSDYLYVGSQQTYVCFMFTLVLYLIIQQTGPVCMKSNVDLSNLGHAVRYKYREED